jgi:hypothetical protein
MGMRYVIPFQGVAITVAQDLWEITIPSTCAAILHEIKVSQSSDATDAQSEQLRFTVRHLTGAPTSGSGGSAATPKPLSPSGATARITAEVNNTTRLTGGTESKSYSDCANVLGPGWHNLAIPEGRWELGPSSFLVIGLETAPADSITASGYVVIEEVG